MQHSIKLVDRDWFPWLDLILVLTAGFMWYLGLTWQPLLVALLPWMIRVASGRFPFRRTPFDVPLVLFLVSAVVGVWASNNQAAAWSKFWLLVGAVLLFYALSGQPQSNLWPLAGLMGVFGVIVGSYFLFTHDWQAFPAKISLFNRVFLGWSEVRPKIDLSPFPPNVAASLMAISLPFLSAWGAHAGHKGQRLAQGAAIIALVCVTTLLFVTTSRGALIALVFALGLYILIWLSQPIARHTNQPRYAIIVFLLLAAVVISAIVMSLYPGGPIALVDNLPGPSSATGRVELSRQTLDLISDFPITGAGLESFPGLYSQYILIIPYFFLPNGHNIFFDVALEQGPLGLVSMFVIFLGSSILLLVGPRILGRDIHYGSDWALLRWAVAAGMIIMLVHGLVEDTVYSSPAIMGLFTLPGLTVAASLPVSEGAAKIVSRGSLLATGTIVLSLVALTFLWFRSAKQSPAAILKANLGAIRMAKIDLYAFPNGEWNESNNLPALRPAEELFNQALVRSDNRTAHYRLGLLALLRQNFDEAIEHLEAADGLGGSHRGIRKNLAYSYVWAGRLEDSLSLLSEIPEAQSEMEVYSWWWGTQGRIDLAARSDRMMTKLAGD